jgi:hypothetical protein
MIRRSLTQPQFVNEISDDRHCEVHNPSVCRELA